MPSQFRGLDIVVAIVTFVVLGGLTIASQHALDPFMVLLVIAFSAATLFRRLSPVLSATAIYGLALAQVLIIGQPAAIDFVVLVSLYSLAVHGPAWARVLGLAGGIVGAVMFASMLVQDDPSTWTAVFVSTAFAVLMAWALGIARHSRAAQIQALKERADALERKQSTDAELAVAAERARIAREMHDIVAHSLAVIIAQADGGRYAAKTDPEQGMRTLETIAEIGRGALADIRRVLGVLRSDEADGPLMRPQPTGQDLGDIIAGVRATGAQVAYTTMGTPRALLPGMGVTLQRVCQEALTNALKHAGPGASIVVTLQWTDEEVMLQVDDDGRGAAAISDGAGTGIVGMRERAALFGGTLQAAPRPTGGYRVKLTLPLPANSKETP